MDHLFLVKYNFIMIKMLNKCNILLKFTKVVRFHFELDPYYTSPT